MLHVEIFDNNYYRHPPWMKGDRNPHRGLYDPSLALLKLARCGKRGSGSPQTSLPSSSFPSKESIDLMRAVRLNRDYSVKLGWEMYRDKIGALLGFTNSSPTEKVFAEAVANWQKKQGLKPDGIIGPTTWSRIKPEIGKAVSTSRVNSETIGNIDRYYGMINEEATSFPFKKISYIQSEAKPAISSTMYSAPSKPTAGSPLPVSPILSGIAVTHVRNNVYPYENGVKIKGTQKFKAFYRDEKDVMLGAVADVEGMYDEVNMYDVGILSWGISQWTLHRESLQEALYFIRTKLGKSGKSELWNTLFPNLDVKLEYGKYRILYKGKSLKTIEELRNTFRGSALRGEYKKEIIEYWARIFANAGRNETIIRLQNELGREKIKLLYDMNVAELKSKYYKSGKTKFGPNYKYRVINYLDRSLKTQLLFYGMWVQNPGGIYLYLKRAIDKIKEEYGNYNIEKWPLNWQNRFEEIFENLLLHARFAMWGRENAAAAKPKPRQSRTDKLLKSYEYYKKLFRL
jgi:hypothetical protein